MFVFYSNMLPKIDFTNYERCYPKRLKNFFRTNINYKTYPHFVEHTSCSTVGSIPHEIVKLFEGNNKSDKIKFFLSELGNTANKIRKGEKIETTKQIFTENLKNIMPENTKIHLDYVGRGGYKSVYRFGISDKNGNKIMHDKALHIYDKNTSTYCDDTHGIYAEPNSWIYLQWNMGHKSDKTQFTKHYISDLRNGYSVTEFIDEEIPKTTKNFEHNRILGLILTDTFNNPRINDKIYDIGGLKKHSDFINDKLTLKYFKKIANRNSKEEREKVIRQLEQQIENPKTPLREKMSNAIEYYKSLPDWYWTKTSENIPICMIW